jgi:acetyl-CoA carboxylase alpha subunit
VEAAKGGARVEEEEEEEEEEEIEDEEMEDEEIEDDIDEAIDEIETDEEPTTNTAISELETLSSIQKACLAFCITLLG